MKKLWAVLLCFVLLFAMTACENSAPAASEEINGTNESDEVVLEEVSEVKTGLLLRNRKHHGCRRDDCRCNRW